MQDAKHPVGAGSKSPELCVRCLKCFSDIIIPIGKDKGSEQPYRAFKCNCGAVGVINPCDNLGGVPSVPRVYCKDLDFRIYKVHRGLNTVHLSVLQQPAFGCVSKLPLKLESIEVAEVKDKPKPVKSKLYNALMWR